MRVVFAGVVAIVGFIAVTACDQRKSADGTPGAVTPAAPAASSSSGTVAGSAVSFMNSAAVGGMLGEQASRLAEQKSNDLKTRDLAKKLAKDHAQANQELSRLAAAKDVVLPRELDQEHQAKLQSLEKAAPDQLDSNYANLMVADHNQAVMLFEQEARTGQDAEVKAFAERQLPKLREHLEQIHQLPGISTAGEPAQTPSTR